jgi:hypothetical protein
MDFKQRLRAFLQQRKNEGYSRFGVPVYVPTDSELIKFEKTAKNIGIPPEWFANLVNHESAGTFSPRIQNPSSMATGLIQFIPSTAAAFNTSVEQLSQMSFVEQLDYVAEYLKRTLKQRKVVQPDGLAKTSLTQPDFFMVVFYPVAVGNPNYRFPNYVSAANNGIGTPIEYFTKVYNVSRPPFADFGDSNQTVQDYINSQRTILQPLPMLSAGRVYMLGGVVLTLGLFIAYYTTRKQ